VGWLRRLLGRGPAQASPESRQGLRLLEEGYAPVSRDTQAAIAELAQVVKSNPDAVEIYLALGNLYRSHGEIERAVQIRHNLIVRPTLDPAGRIERTCVD